MVELVIKIPEETYEIAKQNKWKWPADDVYNAIKNGVLLPKGHGKLKDIDSIKTAFPNGEYVRTESVRATIDHEETIIEAYKEDK